MNKGIKTFITNLVNNNPRYKKFTILDTAVPFKDMYKDTDIPVVQLHSIQSCGGNDIVGFCGVCSWKNNILFPLDGDSYSDEMLIYGYDWFEDNNNRKCLDILVNEW